MPSQHFPLSLSSAPVWGHCPAYVQMTMAFPQVPTTESMEGEAAHWYGEQRLKNIIGPHDRAPNGIVLNDEMRESAGVYIRDVWDAMLKYPGSQVGIEFYGAARSIHPEHCGGTVDAYLFNRSLMLLITWNFKHGHGEVSEFENFQEIGYTRMLLDYLGIDGYQEQFLTVQNRIVQPRCYTAKGIVRTWEYKAVEIRGLVNQLVAAGQRALEPIPEAKSGDYCVHCPGRHSCPAARRVAMNAIDYSGKNIPELMTPDAISFELQLLERAKKAIEARYTGMLELAESTIKRGTLVPGYGLEPTYGRLSWTTPLAAIKMLGNDYGKALTKEVPITPTQAIDAGVPKEIVQKYSERPKSGMRIAKQDADEIRRVLSRAPAHY